MTDKHRSPLALAVRPEAAQLGAFRARLGRTASYVTPLAAGRLTALAKTALHVIAAMCAGGGGRAPGRRRPVPRGGWPCAGTRRPIMDAFASGAAADAQPPPRERHAGAA